jgi:hypothetical protein
MERWIREISPSRPSGVFSVGLDEGRAEGRFVGNRPSRHGRGTIDGFDWKFAGGELRAWTVRKGKSTFERRFDMAGNEKTLPAFLSIGLNPYIADAPYTEDQERGVVTLNIGFNDDFGGKTRGTFREYALLRGASVWIDDRQLLRAGRLL